MIFLSSNLVLFKYLSSLTRKLEQLLKDGRQIGNQGAEENIKLYATKSLCSSVINFKT